MKIIYLIGPDFTVFSLAYPHLKYLIDQKNQVLLLSESFNKNLDLDVNHISIPFSRQKLSYKDFFAIKKINNCIKNFKPDIVYVSTPKASLLGSISCYLKKTKYVYIHRGAYYQNFNSIFQFFFKKIDQFVINNSLRTNFISKSLYNYVNENLDINKSKIFEPKFNSSKGVDTERFKQSLIKNDKIEIIYCGRICIDKGFIPLLNLINKFSNDKNVNIKIVGRLEITNSQINSFMSIIEKSDNIKLIDWTDRLQDFMNIADIHFFPSFREGFGNVAIEAASSGAVTIGRNIPGVQDAIKDGKSGYLLNNDLDMIEKIDYLIENPKKLQEMKLEARKFAIQNFKSSEIIPLILKI